MKKENPIWQPLGSLFSKIRTKYNNLPYYGLPVGLDINLLNQHLPKHNFEKKIKNHKYTHLSGWKVNCAYRISLKTSSGYRNYVYKNAHYSLRDIPALTNLPFTPGHSEYVVYKSHNEMNHYLPTLYMCNQIAYKSHYQYLFEDLNNDYYQPTTLHCMIHLVNQMKQLHEHMSEWKQTFNNKEIFTYDSAYSKDLQKYIYNNLQAFQAAYNSEILAKHFHDLNESLTHHSELLSQYTDLQMPIHGDLNLSNIWLHKTEPKQFKIVDWEWAGMGAPHIDLVSLLWNQPKPVIDHCLSIYAKQNPWLSPGEHQTLFLSYKLERALLNSAFMAAQLLGPKQKTRMQLDKFIEKSLQISIMTCDQLKK